MKGIILFVLFQYFFVLSPFIAIGAPPQLGDTLQHRWDTETRSPYSVLDNPTIYKLHRTHIVWVAGILNELAALVGNYYTDNFKELDDLGIRYTHLAYPSRRSIPENAKQLAIDLRAIYDRENLPIILIGHSMGGDEALFAALQDPDLLLTHKVEKIILIQAPVRGSIFADNIKSGPVEWFVRALLQEGIKSLETEIARTHFAQTYERFQDLLSVIFHNSGSFAIPRELEHLSQRMYYVRSSLSDESELSWGLRIVRSFCKSETGSGIPNDGLVATSDQTPDALASFGIDLGILEADHIELVVSGAVARGTQERRRAFTRALLHTVMGSTISK